MSEQKRIYKAADYLRLSKEDGDFSVSPGKVESNSISSQRELIRRFVEQYPDIELVEEFIDDGYTGTSFDRPDFQRLMEAVEMGLINCIIVKDLSRFGREYIDAGQYIEKLFPRYGVRFIAINDGVDTGLAKNGADSLMIPFKNLINDSYSRDISIKVRSSLEAKRRRGDFIANFACYGYERDPEDKNELVIDTTAAAVVRDIFRWRIEGLSPDRIAERLNMLGIDCPAAYKSAKGSKYKSGFRKYGLMQWCAKSVIRILTNEVYCGVLIQGKRTTPNYKVKKQFTKEQNQWARVENNHESIVTRQEFQIVQRLMSEDARIRADAVSVRPLAGRVFCGSCGARTKRKSVTRNGKTYVYYSCPNSAGGGNCEHRTISESELEKAVLFTLRSQIALILEVRDKLSEDMIHIWETRAQRRLELAIHSQEDQVQKNKELIVSIYEDYRDGLIDRSEMTQLKDAFTKKISESERCIASLRQELANTQNAMPDQDSWFSQFRMYQNINDLTRPVVVNLVDTVLLFQGKQIQIILRYQDQINDLLRFAGDVHEATGAIIPEWIKERV